MANTFKGLAYLYMLNAQGTNGVRLSVEDPFKPSKAATYAGIIDGHRQDSGRWGHATRSGRYYLCVSCTSGFQWIQYPGYVQAV